GDMRIAAGDAAGVYGLLAGLRFQQVDADQLQPRAIVGLAHSRERPPQVPAEIEHLLIRLTSRNGTADRVPSDTKQTQRRLGGSPCNSSSPPQTGQAGQAVSVPD